MPDHINFVTGNANKLREVQAILEPGISVHSQPLDVEEVQGTVEEVTIAKTRKAADLAGGPVLVEDTALSFNALGGLPGPYMQVYSCCSKTGLDLRLNNLIAAYEDKSAEAICTFGYSAGPGQEPVLFQGRCPGKIVPARGPSNFGNFLFSKIPSYIVSKLTVAGWDPCFEFEGKTFAEMDGAEKNKISHRARALKKLQDWFKEQNAA
ncbi:inosine triphosphate pyrophosphatase [Geosmithia morbida]|uniref:Inosine triphosphate pyrophosphatase n=1 Tax=Geosmithia morbida TaxID=1094350 RepID=A0A9P4YSE5_9HYPO|nr:inosine triphosphate pyrophosphatase [Geosmithia morbida]KAF4120134.1 inosine triphosphate pyrophosphatase [Geosmithia morbida]